MNTFYAIGMGCASFTIIWMRIQLEWHAIIFCSIGAFFGMVFGTWEWHFFLLVILWN